jgi:hypothetical protein
MRYLTLGEVVELHRAVVERTGGMASRTRPISFLKGRRRLRGSLKGEPSALAALR